MTRSDEGRSAFVHGSGQTIDVLVVGAGIAGLSAAAEARRLGLSTLVAVGGLPGGQLVNIDSITGLDDHPEGVAGYELLPELEAAATAAGVTYTAAALEGLKPSVEGWTALTDGGDIAARSVIVATGSRFATLGVDGEVELAGRGVGHCASCDAPLLRGKTVVVVGGGDSALQESLTLAAHAGRLLVVHEHEELRAQPVFVEAIAALGNVEVRGNATVDAILGDDRVEAVRIRDLITGATDAMAADAVFVYIGQVPNTDWVADLVELDDDGRIAVGADLAASVPGVFAAGAVRSGTRARAASARSDGVDAARSAHNHLTQAQVTTERGPEPASEASPVPTMVVHDPRGFAPEVGAKPLSPRLDTLDGKHLYLVDCLFDNSDVFVAELRDWLARHHPATDVEVIRPTLSWVDDPEMRAAIVADGDAAILAVGL